MVCSKTSLQYSFIVDGNKIPEQSNPSFLGDYHEKFDSLPILVRVTALYAVVRKIPQSMLSYARNEITGDG